MCISNFWGTCKTAILHIYIYLPMQKQPKHTDHSLTHALHMHILCKVFRAYIGIRELYFPLMQGPNWEVTTSCSSVDQEDMVLTSNQTSRLTYLRIWGSGNLPPAFFPLGRLKLQIFTHRPEELWNAGGSGTTATYSLTHLAKSLYRRKFACLNLYNCVSSRVISVIATSLGGVTVKWVHVKLWTAIFLLLLVLNLAVQEVFLHLIPGTVTTNTSFCRCPSTLSGKHSSFTIAFQSRLVWFKIYTDTEYTRKIVLFRQSFCLL